MKLEGSGGGGGVRWGVLSTARINEAVLRGVDGSPAVDVAAVASRSAEAAAAFAEEHGIARAHGSYEALLADPGVDAVYIPLPNGMHTEWTIAALEAGKHVLCEKPLTPRLEEAERCFDTAERRGLVLSEGFMWRHHPQTARLVELVESGAIGELRLIRAAFSFTLDRPADVRWDPDLDGGALLDVGSYCVSAARLLAGEPESVSGDAVMTARGVDSRFAATMHFGEDRTALFDCGFDLPPRGQLEVVGSAGTLFLADPWHCREPGIVLRRGGGAPETVEIERADAYRLEFEDMSAAIRDARPPRLGRADGLGQARALEALLRSAAERAPVQVP